MKPAYYNDNDAYCAQWLRNLIAAGHLPAGEVDERPIQDVRGVDLGRFGQCHFFAGIGGWPLALRLAGWPDDRDVWTGSSPCQDNSVAAGVTGQRTGLEGERSGLVFTWLNLIGLAKPCTVLFENVIGIKPWLHHVTESLGLSGYRVSKSERSSSSVGASHPRKRVWVAAERDGERLAITRQPDPCKTFCDPRAAPPGNYWTETERGFRPMDDGLPVRMAQIRAFGNSIDPFVAAEFIAAVMECRP